MLGISLQTEAATVLGLPRVLCNFGSQCRRMRGWSSSRQRPRRAALPPNAGGRSKNTSRSGSHHTSTGTLQQVFDPTMSLLHGPKGLEEHIGGRTNKSCIYCESTRKENKASQGEVSI